jgi:hypothetical protein
MQQVVWTDRATNQSRSSRARPYNCCVCAFTVIAPAPLLILTICYQDHLQHRCPIEDSRGNPTPAEAQHRSHLTIYSVVKSACALLPGVTLPTMRAHAAKASVSMAGGAAVACFLPCPRLLLLAALGGAAGSWSAQRLRRSYRSYTEACSGSSSSRCAEAYSSRPGKTTCYKSCNHLVHGKHCFL